MRWLFVVVIAGLVVAAFAADTIWLLYAAAGVGGLGVMAGPLNR